MNSWDEIKAATKQKLLEPPPGATAFTTQQYADELGLSWHAARRAINASVRDGVLTVGQQRLGRLGVKVVYWLTPKEKRR